MAWHLQERSATVAALREAGPGAPTLCEGWRTEHLAAHLVLRESSPAAVGVVVPGLAARTERLTQALGDRSTRPDAWERLLARVAGGPPVWHPLRWVGDAAQLVEFHVHAEDVRRGGPDGALVAPRDLPPAHEAALWGHLRRMSRLLLHRSPVRLLLTEPSGRTIAAGARDGDLVEVQGRPGELVLWAFDRPQVAHVRLVGPPPALDALAHFRAPAPTG
ncbi:TIGR03085 family metal-binding protein [Actinotalea sp. AC32]|nr:TIGR03085 family metal-binding protein [Actinotalea sp. AC32]